VLLNDCRDQVNFGSNALVDGLLQILSRGVPNATILPIPSHWLIDASQGFGAFVSDGIGLKQPRATFPTVADQFETVADEWLRGGGGPGAQEFLSRFEAADLVILNGEGSIYRTNLSAVRELFLAWLCKERLGIPTVYLNGGLHLTDVMPILPAMVRKTFQTLDAVGIREAWSLRNLHDHVPGVDAQLFPDAAFVFTPADARETAATKDVRARIGGLPYFCFDPGTMPMDDRDVESSALHRLIARLKQVAPQAAFVCSGPADRYIERIASETGSQYIDSVTDYRELMTLLRDAEFLVSGRYHNIILGAIMGCPSIAFASPSHKVRGACEMLENVVGTPYDGTNMRPHLDQMEDVARAYMQDRAKYRVQLQEVCTRRRDEAFEMVGVIRAALGQSR
jgi:polysaccharide pyruvyl transferase WcaK-like protein